MFLTLSFTVQNYPPSENSPELSTLTTFREGSYHCAYSSKTAIFLKSPAWWPFHCQSMYAGLHLMNLLGMGISGVSVFKHTETCKGHALFLLFSVCNSGWTGIHYIVWARLKGTTFLLRTGILRTQLCDCEEHSVCTDVENSAGQSWRRVRYHRNG